MADFHVIFWASRAPVDRFMSFFLGGGHREAYLPGLSRGMADRRDVSEEMPAPMHYEIRYERLIEASLASRGLAAHC